MAYKGALYTGSVRAIRLESLLVPSEVNSPYVKWRLLKSNYCVPAPGVYGHMKHLTYSKIPISWNRIKLFKLQKLDTSALSEMEMPF